MCSQFSARFGVLNARVASQLCEHTLVFKRHACKLAG
jgi:hypothetical protein